MSTGKKWLMAAAAILVVSAPAVVLSVSAPAHATGIYDSSHYRPVHGKPRSVFRNPVGRLDTTIPRKLPKLQVAPTEFKDGFKPSTVLPRDGAPRTKGGRGIGSPAPLTPILPPAAAPTLPPLPPLPPLPGTPPLFSPQATPPTITPPAPAPAPVTPPIAPAPPKR